jgi:cytochrome c5
VATHPSLKDPMAKVYLLISLLFILGAVFYLVTSLISTIGKNSLKGEIDTDTLVANNAAMIESTIKPIGEVATSDGAGAGAAAPAGGSARSGEEVYTAVCMACHATGAAGAPKVDDKAAWEPRVATGIDALMNSAINGKGAMPPRAGQNISDDELKAAIGFMITKAGFNLDLGAAPVVAAPAESKAETPTAPEAKEEAPAAPVQEAAPAAPTTPAKPEAPVAPAEEAAPAPDVAPAEATTATPQEKHATEEVAAAPATQESGVSGEKIYKATCFACHDMGVAGAPKLGDKALWEPRIATGKDTLYGSAINGKTTPAGMMPPKGGNTSLSDDEVKAAVDYMVSQAQ